MLKTNKPIKTHIPNNLTFGDTLLFRTAVDNIGTIE